MLGPQIHSLPHWYVQNNIEPLNQKSEGYAFYVIDPSGQTSKLDSQGKVSFIAGLLGDYRILAGFPPGSNSPTWDNTFDLDYRLKLVNRVFVLKKDYCLWTDDICKFL